MNEKLYAELVNARKFLIEDQKNINRIKKQKNEILFLKSDLNMHIPKYEEEKIKWSNVFFMFWIFAPAAIIYLIVKKLKEKSAKKKYQKLVESINNSPSEIEYKRQKKAEIQNAQFVLERFIAERENYYNNNYNKYLGFLPENLRKKESIEVLMHYVKTGQANTLNKAWSLYARELRDLESIREKREEKELQERQHKETLKALEKISRNQEKINHELEVANKYSRGEYR